MNTRLTVLGVVALAAIGLAAYLFLRPRAEAPLPAPVPPPETAAQKPADLPLPPAAQSDATLRADFGNVSPKVQQWLAQPDLLDRFAALVDDLARDVSPRGQLEFLAPKERFRVEKGKIDPKSYQRYDAAADAIASVDAQKFLEGVRAVHPLLDSAYHRIANPDGRFDDAAKAALQRLIDAPVVDQPIAVVSQGANDRFADEKLETLGPVEKQLLRLGPRNTRLIQSKARELLQAMQH
jgi:hypothetical protein